MPNWIFTAIVIILIIIYIWRVQYYKIKCERVFIDDLINSNLLKTGDLIIFKAYNNFNSIITSSYFGHIGMVVIDDKRGAMLFEANGMEKTPMKNHRTTTGIFYTPLLDRVRRYKGRCFWRSLNKKIDERLIAPFMSFINYALCNMRYEYDVVKSWLAKIIGAERCLNNTNCAELIFLCWIKLNLLPLSDYEKINTHYLKYVCAQTKMLNNYKYSELIEVVDEHFAHD